MRDLAKQESKDFVAVRFKKVPARLFILDGLPKRQLQETETFSVRLFV